MQNICPVCQSTSIKIFLERKNVPIHQNFLFAEQARAKQIHRGDLSIAICLSCGFVYNASFASIIMSYNQCYENTQNYSPLFEQYVDKLVENLVDRKGIKNARIIEVGCGKGTFLRKLVEVGNNSGIGFDPSYDGPLDDFSGRLHYRKEFYNDKFAHLITDFVVCRHVIEHIPEPIPMLRSIRYAMANSPNARVFFETPDIEWILENDVVWDFFYEHCSYFNRQSLRTAFENSGFHVDMITSVFGNQYLWLEARPTSISQVPTLQAGHIIKMVEKFEQTNTMLNHKWAHDLQRLKKQGPVVLWGAGAKGVTFANLFDPHMEFISCVVDINPNKQGKFLPGTGHPICSPDNLPKYNPRTILFLNPNYHQEIDAQMRDLKIKNCTLLEFSTRSHP
jgi:SAM-dependent methyltransferase